MSEDLAITVKISELDLTNSLNHGDVLPVVQNGITKKIDKSGLIHSLKLGLGSAATASLEDFASATAVVEIAEQSQAKANEQNQRIDRIEYAIYLIRNNGVYKAYRTKSLMLTDINNIPVNSIVSVASDPDNNQEINDLNGEYLWDGISFYKLPNNFLNLAKHYTNQQITMIGEILKTYTDERVLITSQNAKQYADLTISKTIEPIIGAIGSNSFTPLAIDKQGNIPVWLDNGLLDFADSKAIGKSEESSIVPLVVDAAGNIPIWLKNGCVGFSGLDENTLEILKGIFQSSPYKTSALNIIRPISTDSTTLRRWKAKVAKIKSGIVDQLRVVMTGDSWTEHSTIATELKTILQNEYGVAGSGWINLGTERNMLDEINITYSSGWVVEDLDKVNSFQYGCAPDGFTRTNSTAGSTITLSNLVNGDLLNVFFGNTGGVFSYSVNGSPEVNINAGSSQKFEIILSAKSTVVLKVISGTICFFGMHLRKSTGSGVELNKIGNGGATGQDYLKISPTTQNSYSSFLNADVLIIILGTNDYRLGHSITNYKLGVGAIIDGFRSSNPKCAVILVIPAKSNVSEPIIPLSNFAEAAFELSQEKKCEIYNMFDDWDEYVAENEYSQWKDALHVSKAGAQRLSTQIFLKFLEA